MIFTTTLTLPHLRANRSSTNLPWRPTHPCQNHLYQHSPPWWLIIMLTFSALIAHWPTLFTQLVVFHLAYIQKIKSRELCSMYLVSLDGPPTLVSTNQAVWGAPGTQGRLVHLGENISVRNLMFDLSLRQAQLTAFLFQKVGIGKTKFLLLVVYNFFQSQPTICKGEGVRGTPGCD